MFFCYLCVRHLGSLHNDGVNLVEDPAEPLVLRDQHLLVRLQLPDRDRRTLLLLRVAVRLLVRLGRKEQSDICSC